MGEGRPPFAVAPGPGQESVWDYPRPPRVEDVTRRVTVEHEGVTIARTDRALRVIETASPPTVYVPPADVEMPYLAAGTGVSRCEWKGEARYWDLVSGERRVEAVAWSYAEPFVGFEALRDYLAFYPGRVTCRLGDERVEPQPGRFYGGWVTRDLVGPFKGEPGSSGW